MGREFAFIMSKTEYGFNSGLLIFLCCLVYFAGYITRVNFAAATSEIILSEGFIKSEAGMVTTMSFASYGIGQLISGVLGDKINARKLVFGGLMTTALLNCVVSRCTTVSAMSAVWFMNGLAQSALWPPMVKIMSVCLDKQGFARGCTLVSVASSAGTVAVYFLVPLCIAVSDWRMVFYVSGLFGILTSFIWLIFTKKAQVCLNRDKIEQQKIAVNNQSNEFLSVLLSGSIVCIVTAITLHGALKDGITTWIPSYLIETFSVGSHIAILCSVLLPVMGIAGMQIASVVYGRRYKNELGFSALYFIIAFICGSVLFLNVKTSMVLSVVLASVINSCMYAVNIMLICMAPARFARYGKISTVSGIFNFFTYAGSALSSYLFAKITECYGWNITIAFWAFLCFIGVVLCLAGKNMWQKKWNR